MKLLYFRHVGLLDQSPHAEGRELKCSDVTIGEITCVSPLAEGRELAWLLAFGKEGRQPRFHPLLLLQKNFPHPLDKTVGIGYNNQCRR